MKRMSEIDDGKGKKYMLGSAGGEGGDPNMSMALSMKPGGLE